MHRYLVSLRLASALEAMTAGERDLSRIGADAGFAHQRARLTENPRIYGGGVAGNGANAAVLTLARFVVALQPV
jgi:hypothetical protein